MKRSITIVAVAVSIIIAMIPQFSSETIFVREYPVIEPKGFETVHELKSMLAKIATERGLPNHKIIEIEKTIGGEPGTGCPNGESTWNPRAVGDHGKARGLVQINENYYPEVTPEQAFDPEFALTFIVDKFAEGKETHWTCWREIFQSTPLSPTA